jgi:predicted nucleic acid-binding Zn ribbon protein
MRRSNTQNIGEVIQEVLKELHIDEKLKEISIINAWDEVVGEKFAKYTDGIYVKNKVLFVHLKSPIVRSELAMHKSALIKGLNEKAGSRVIEEVVLR